MHKEGRRIRLQEQPFQILKILLESPGEVVSRDEIRKRLWPDGTLVEFDHGINAAVKRLREALRDSADKPRYIETVARRGYRFIGEVDAADRSAPVAKPAVIPGDNSTNHSSPRRSSRLIISAGALAGIVIVVWAGAEYYKRGALPSPRTLQPLVRLDLDLGSDVSPGLDRSPSAVLPPMVRVSFMSRSRSYSYGGSIRRTPPSCWERKEQRLLSSHRMVSGWLSSQTGS
jgi:DNA-binding winged helix-turn-helix (wHTH) protein